MSATIDIYSQTDNEIKKFISSFYDNDIWIDNNFNLKIIYDNPIQAADIIGCYIDNNDKFKINMWVSFDKDFYINITEHNADKIIRYLYERYPY